MLFASSMSECVNLFKKFILTVIHIKENKTFKFERHVSATPVLTTVYG